MKKRKNIIISSYVKKTGIGLLVCLMIVVAICLIKSDYRNVKSFSNTLFYIGAAELFAGGINFMGSTMVKGDVTYQLARTSTDDSIQKRTRKDMDSTEQRSNFVIHMSIIGALMICFSVVVSYVLL